MSSHDHPDRRRQMRRQAEGHRRRNSPALDPVSLAKLLSTLVSTGNEAHMTEERERLLAEARALVEARPGA